MEQPTQEDYVRSLNGAVRKHILPKFIELNNQIPGILPLSFSKIQQGITCPARMKFRYLTNKEELRTKKKLREPRPIATSGVAIGNFLHRVLEDCVVKCNLYGWTKEILDFDFVWSTCIKSGGLTLGEYNIVQQYRGETEEIMDTLAKLRMKYNYTYYPEMRCEAALNGYLYKSVKPINKFSTIKIDIVGVNEETREGVIIDYKSYTPKTEASEEEIKDQLKYYGFHLIPYFNLESCNLCGGYIQQGKIVKIGEVTEASYKEVEEQIVAFMEKFYDVAIRGPKISDNDFNVNEYCKYCEVVEFCPVYTEVHSEDDYKNNNIML